MGRFFPHVDVSISFIYNLANALSHEPTYVLPYNTPQLQFWAQKLWRPSSDTFFGGGGVGLHMEVRIDLTQNHFTSFLLLFLRDGELHQHGWLYILPFLKGKVLQYCHGISLCTSAAMPSFKMGSAVVLSQSPPTLTKTLWYNPLDFIMDVPCIKGLVAILTVADLFSMTHLIPHYTSLWHWDILPVHLTTFPLFPTSKITASLPWCRLVLPPTHTLLSWGGGILAECVPGTKGADFSICGSLKSLYGYWMLLRGSRWFIHIHKYLLSCFHLPYSEKTSQSRLIAYFCFPTQYRFCSVIDVNTANVGCFCIDNR